MNAAAAEGDIERANEAESSRQQEGRPGKLRGWLQVISIPVLIVIGSVLGALTGFAPMSSFLGIGLPLLVATWYLRQSGVTWGQLVGARRVSVYALAGYAAVAVVVSGSVAFIVIWLLQNYLGLPRIDVSRFVELVTDNPVMYAWYLIPVAWGSAAVGEELLCRGFLLHRLEGLTRTWVAIILQAVIFASVHFYQGITGVIAVFLLAVVFGAVYIKCGRSLLPVIIAHGLIDTWAMTVVFLGRPDLLIGT